MKLLTINVHSWLEDNQEDKLNHLAQVINKRDYDVIALQEVNQSFSSPYVSADIREDNYGLLLIQRLRELGNDQYSYHWTFSHIGYDRYEEGLAILTKHPVIEKEAFYCSRSRKATSIASRKTLRIRLSYGKELIDCYSCHMNLPRSKEEDYLSNIQALFSQNRDTLLNIYLGDFNIDAVSQKEAYQAIKSEGVYDSYQLAHVKDSGITVSKSIDGWDSHHQEKRLDYIFLNQEKSVLSSTVIFNGENEAIISDHYGLEVILEV